MLQDQDRIFTNIYGMHDRTLAGASFASMVNYLIPVWGLMVGVTVMGEALQPRAVAALLLILGGIMLAERRPVRKIE